jgi:hypothetical protein
MAMERTGVSATWGRASICKIQAGKRMADPNLKPKPLKPDSRVWDRVEYLLQWLVWQLVVYSPERPGLSAMITSVRLITFLLLIIGIGYGVWFLINHL